MKIMIKLLVLVLIGAVVAPLVIKGPDGKPMMAWQDFFSSTPTTAYISPSKGSSSLTTVYKWKDADGQWHFSDKTVEGNNHETIKYNPKSNIIQSLAKKEEPNQFDVDDRFASGRQFAANAVGTRRGRNEEEEEGTNLNSLINEHHRSRGGNSGSNGTTTGGPGLTTVSLADVPELIEQAKQVQALVDQRNESLRQATSGIMNK